MASYIKQIHDTKRPIIITQHGKDVAVLLGTNEFETMQEKVDLLSDVQTSFTQLGLCHKGKMNNIVYNAYN